MVTVHMKDRGQRDAVNKEWVKMFPDETNRPARKAVRSDSLVGVNLIQLEAVAWLGS